MTGQPTDSQNNPIDCWRGQCLNYYAKGEKAVALAMELVCIADNTKKIRHLAGQRLADLISVVENEKGTQKQKTASHSALETWQKVEKQRQYLAHGIVVETQDKNGKWIALFDIVTYRANEPLPDRWAVRQDEAAQFLDELSAAFKELSSQLGQFKKRNSS